MMVLKNRLRRAPVMELGVQDLVLLEKSAGGIQKRFVCGV